MDSFNYDRQVGKVGKNETNEIVRCTSDTCLLSRSLVNHKEKD